MKGLGFRKQYTFHRKMGLYSWDGSHHSRKRTSLFGDWLARTVESRLATCPVLSQAVLHF